jgi:membrane-bound lytic murein transglycosylase B
MGLLRATGTVVLLVLVLMGGLLLPGGHLAATGLGGSPAGPSRPGNHVAAFGIGGSTAGQDSAPVAPVPPLPMPPFDVWLAELRTEAESRGIRPEIVERAFAHVEEPVAQILERDRSQAEFRLDLEGYLKRRLTVPTVRMARQMYKRHRTLVTRVGTAYDVDPRLLIAVWGLESNFGRFAGVRPTIPTLATLAYDPRRGTMFRNELFSALEILNRGDIELEKLRGSWAGALGQPQFMPSSYLRYAQDFDGDGRRNIWTSQPDVFASIAYYLQQHGWKPGQRWGREVFVPADVRLDVTTVPLRSEGCRARRAMTVPQPLATWRKLGLRTVAKQPLPRASIAASLISDGGRAFLVYDNYEALLDYNCAHTYALSVALLADRL